MTDQPTLVLGGTGKTGRRVVTRLTRRDLPVRVGSRTAGVPFDWQRPDTWPAALDGVGAVYISYFPDIAAPGAADAVGEFARVAVTSGARRLVLLSGRGEERARQGEQAVRDSGGEVTLVRCAWFNQNFSEDFLLDAVLAGEVALPAGEVAEPFVDADDIAEVAAMALTEDGHGGELYELTGPRLLTFSDAVGEIAAATGRPIQYIQVSLEDYAAGATAHGVPADVVAALSHVFGEVLDGRNAHLCDGVQRALGRPPRDFTDYVRDTAATGVWSPR